MDQVAWLLGINFTIQVVPAAGDGSCTCWPGRTKRFAAAAASFIAPPGGVAGRAASLVVAAIEGGRPQQTWENLGRTLATAARLVEDGGAIAVCCELAAAPGAGSAGDAGRPLPPRGPAA